MANIHAGKASGSGLQADVISPNVVGSPGSVEMQEPMPVALVEKYGCEKSDTEADDVGAAIANDVSGPSGHDVAKFVGLPEGHQRCWADCGFEGPIQQSGPAASHMWRETKKSKRWFCHACYQAYISLRTAAENASRSGL